MSGVVEAFEEATAALFGQEWFVHAEIVQQTVRQVGSTAEFRLMLDRPEGVDIALCEAVARHVNAALRERTELYTLQVESAGLERPLMNERDYERFAGRRVCIKTFELLDGAKTHRGLLSGMRDGEVVIVEDDTERRFPYSAIKQAKLEFDIREALRKNRSSEPGKSGTKSRKERRTS